ncbi:cell division protein [Pedobacter yulinensis]|uniref:Cell division protein n=1 Tax=Pedobacter yulinensis TaxID=2126353 RepID=A0A2T3HHI1_9SPHI|nr:penicillin-binding protein [Pedobacter yulinensis]PST81892.1 cell division protein [Pedobacter yulinensis]
MNIRTNILLRVYLAFGLIVLLAVAVLVRLCQVQYIQGSKWRAMADSLSTRYMNVEAVRGNIYSVDGSLLATSVPEYELRVDLYAGGIQDDRLFNSKVDSLAMKLASFFKDRSAKEYSRYLRHARQDSVRYLLLKRRVSYQDLKEVRSFPLFNVGKYSGGLIAVQQNKRVLPFRALAARTIGYKNDNVSNPVGLEGAYGDYINGETGKRLMQRIAGGVWMPVNDEAEVSPKDGADIISTIDINMQDLAQSALEKQLIKADADHGTVILMEVNTGEVRAVANYTRESEGVYKEKFNYAIAASQDPGSTFKLASYMALLEDGKIDTNDYVETGNYRIPGHTIKDSHGSIGTVTVKKAFEESSNAAIAKLVNTHYKDNPKQFTDHLYDIHMNEKLQLQIPGEARPVIKNPSNKSWNKNMTLPQMAYGYEMQITPLQMLAFYNAVANNGRYIAPIFVREIRRLGNPIEQFQARVIKEQICSEKTVKTLQEMLEGVISEGTGKQIIYNPLYKVAGKTGTAQVADDNRGYKGKRSYQASFCGYFPADKPKYSMIVVINNPKKISYYGSFAAGPVFREIADRIYASDMRMYNPVSEVIAGTVNMPRAKSGQIKATKKVYRALGLKPLFASNSEYFNAVDESGGLVFEESNTPKGSMPNVKGMGLKDALYLLGNVGLKAKIKGSGKVIAQSIAPGSRIGKGLSVFIELE